MIDKIRRKDIFLADLEGIGSEERGIRPVLIVQNNLGNKHSTTTIIIPFTRRIENYGLPTHLQIEPFNKMKYKATIMAEQIRVIDKKRLKYRIDKLSDEYMKKVDYAIAIAIGLKEGREHGK